MDDWWPAFWHAMRLRTRDERSAAFDDAIRRVQAEGIRDGMERAARIVDECERGEHGGLANAAAAIRACKEGT